MYAAQAGYEKGFAGATVGVIMALAMFFVGRTGFIIAPLRRAGDWSNTRGRRGGIGSGEEGRDGACMATSARRGRITATP